MNTLSASRSQPALAVSIVLLVASFAVPSPARAAVDFVFNFTDAPGIGFNAAGQTGIDRRAGLNQAAGYIESFLGAYTATLQIDVNGGVTTDNVLASASSNFNGAYPGLGFGDRGDVMIKILGGADPDAGVADGVVNWNFQDHNWEPLSDFQPGELDFISTGIHELTHALGFAAGISESGEGGYGAPLGAPTAWSPYAQFLADSTGSIINGGTFSMDITRWNVAKVGKNGSTGTGGLFFNGPNALAANGGIPLSLYSPTTYLPGSTASHLDTDFYVASNGQIENMMNHSSSLAEGLDIRDYTPLEIGILKDIGYTQIIPEPSAAVFGAIGILGWCSRRLRKNRNG